MWAFKNIWASCEIWFFFFSNKNQTEQTVADLACSPCICDLWPPHLLVPWPHKIRHWLLGCRWVDGCPWTWLLEVPSVTHSGLWPGLISPSVLKVGDDTGSLLTCWYLLQMAHFFQDHWQVSRVCQWAPLAGKSWNLEALKVFYLSLLHFTLIYIYSSFSFRSKEYFHSPGIHRHRSGPNSSLFLFTHSE